MRLLVVSWFVGAIGLGLHTVTTDGSDPPTEADYDPDRSVAAAIELLAQSGDTEQALDRIYSAIASEARTRSGRVNSLHLQSAALQIRRGDIDTAVSYLNLALEFDDRAAMHDPQAFGVSVAGAPFMPTWPMTMLVGALSLGLGVALFGQVRRRWSAKS